MRRDVRPAKSGTAKIKRTRTAHEPVEGMDNDPLWPALKAKRVELAREQNVPAFVIFHDSTLLEIFQRRPGSLTELGQISGIGKAKLEKYGEVVLRVLGEAAG
jgi:ATP-dependent DNA helicase RecQ